ncbi:LAMC1 [Lepeophtheirus salmonis]|uniref:Semaphorin-2A n=1 Tax=Lepeophtheirus salmonis TaxID=72036 RepID=A0A7R8H063_LEPSM|nr:LAMC1 [Lepeophtheirus salmonis]CAF2763318.1 LAMC1 [Lepeophtheirus salmonis]
MIWRRLILVCVVSTGVLSTEDRGSGKQYLKETEERYGGPWVYRLFEGRMSAGGRGTAMLLLWTLLLDSVSGLGSPYVEELRCLENDGYYRTLTLDEKRGVLYVGGMDVLIRGNANNISLTSCSTDILRMDPDKVDSCVGRGKSSEFQCRNHIRVIESSMRISLDLGDMSSTLGSETALPSVPYDPDDNSTAIWVTSGNPGELPAIYSATNAEFTKADTVIFRGDIFDPVSNRREYTYKRTIKYDSYMLDKPDFVASFEVGEYVFFFFREIAIEYINCGKVIYSRVARVCKSDVGGKNILHLNWVTYLKARLNCSIPGEFPFFFNEIQHVFKSEDDNTFHAVFTTSNNGLRGSAICSFRLEDVEKKIGKSSVPQPRPGTCVKDTRNLPDSVLNFIRKHPLMDADFMQEDMVKKRKYTIFYAGTDNGKIYKVSRWKDSKGEYQSRLLDILSVFEDGEAVRAMTIATKQRKSLFVSSDKTIKQVDLHLCSSRYDSCVKCLRDPYCGWDREAGKCRPYHLGLLQDPSEAEHGLCKASTPTQKLIANFGQSVHLPCQLRQDNEGEGVSWYRFDNRRGKRYPVHQSFDKYVITNDNGLVIIGINENDAGKYDCVLNEKDIVNSYHIAVDSHRCSAPNKTADYQKIYSDWCHEFQRYKSALKTWELKQAQCGTCECNGWSMRCRFNEQLYMESGHGGECMDCEGNRDDRIPCEPCNCDPTGSKTLQCADNGICDCKPGVTGEKCNQCKADFWNFGTLGCKECGCLPEGCIGNKASCDTKTGYCHCKQNKMNLDVHLVFCYGHTSECELSGGYTKFSILSDFSRSSEDWTSFEQDESLPLRYDGINKLIGVQSLPIQGSQSGGAYFYAPPAFLGDLRASYNQELSFRLRINNAGPRPDRYDIIIQGGGVKETMISLPITKQNNPMPNYEMQDYKFRLHEKPGIWDLKQPGLKDAIVLRDIKVNICQFCMPGYHHKNNGGPFARCIPCSCNGHADICDTESGKCECKDKTDGQNCEKCARGYYGNALNGSPNDCQACPCPKGGACLEIAGNPESPICIECPDGRTGPRCELCKDGYFGDPMGQKWRVTGECLRCIDNTDGFNCQQCKSGFFGDALAIKKPGDPPNCQHCQCYPVGTNLDTETFLPICNGFTGDCSLVRDVNRVIVTQQAPKTKVATWETGQCNCNEGVTGQRCDTCMAFHYGFSQDGCKPCDCDPSGSTDLQCDFVTGQCPCREKVEGRKCDRCMENTKSQQIGPYGGEKICEPCDDCYNLVLDSANRHRNNLETLENLLQQIAENPEPVGDDFEYQLRGLRVRVAQTLVDARISSQNEEGNTLRGRLEELRLKLEEVISQVMEANRQIETAKQHGVEADDKVRNAKEVIERAKESLKVSQRQLETQGRDALMKAQEKSKKAGNLAEKLVEDASEITSIARQASNTSSKAYEMTREALEEQHIEANQIDILNHQVDEMGLKGLEIPQVNSEEVSEKASQVEVDAERIRGEAERLIQDNMELLQQTQDKRAMLEELLNRANVQQQEVDRQLADMDEFRNRAINAVKSGNDILKDAQATLETLQAFGGHVDENRDSAKEAMKNVDYIENIIRDSEGKTNEARESLSGADTYANLSLSVAKHAKDIAEEASVNADKIVNESAVTWEQAKELSSSVASLEDKMEETKSIIEEKELVAEQDGQLAKTALAKANEAQIKARDAVEKVNNAKKELDNIAVILANVQEPEPGLIERLEVRVQMAEEKYKAADLELRLKELEEAKQRQAERIHYFMSSLNVIKMKLGSIEEIRRALPNTCWNKIRLEP